MARRSVRRRGSSVGQSVGRWAGRSPSSVVGRRSVHRRSSIGRSTTHTMRKRTHQLRPSMPKDKSQRRHICVGSRDTPSAWPGKPWPCSHIHTSKLVHESVSMCGCVSATAAFQPCHPTSSGSDMIEEVLGPQLLHLQALWLARPASYAASGRVVRPTCRTAWHPPFLAQGWPLQVLRRGRGQERSIRLLGSYPSESAGTSH